MREQIVELLASGLSKQDVCNTLGISTALLDEHLKDKEVLHSLTSRARELQEDRIVKKYSDLEEAALKGLQQEIKSGMLDVPSMCRILETVNKNKLANRQPAGHFQNPSAHLSVTLVLPSPAQAEKVVVDSKNQVVAIGSRNMAPLPSSQVQQLFKTFDNASKTEDNNTIDVEDDLVTPDEMEAYRDKQVAVANFA